MLSLCLVAGDPSGDAHAAHLATVLKRLDPAVRLTGLGGPQMRSAGVTVLDELTAASSIGPFDAARHVGRFVQARNRLAAHLAAERPDAVIPVDFGDFNLPVVAPLAKRYGCRVLYYVSPQLWAWGGWRLRWVKRYVDRMIVLFKFEEAFYRRHGVPVTWVGHPLVDTARASCSKADAARELGLNPCRITVGLLPGSRAREIARHLPLFLRAAEAIAWQMPGVQFLLPRAVHAPARLFDSLRPARGVDLITCENRFYDSLQLMEAAIVASGTATLDAALFEVPMAVVYRTSLATYLAAKAVVRVPHIGMVNLIAGREIVPEFIQARATPRRVGQAIVSLLRDQERRRRMKADLRMVKAQLGASGAVERTARAVLGELRNSGKFEVGSSKKEGI